MSPKTALMNRRKIVEDRLYDANNKVIALSKELNRIDAALDELEGKAE